mmetsp:Transcript_86032/g.172267  ORF Transcript_86032/g.172267 Transcript_86032/m.172267 type:complete len:283 (-) Transcript_86032:497-1345(-)
MLDATKRLLFPAKTKLVLRTFCITHEGRNLFHYPPPTALIFKSRRNRMIKRRSGAFSCLHCCFAGSVRREVGHSPRGAPGGGGGGRRRRSTRVAIFIVVIVIIVSHGLRGIKAVIAKSSAVGLERSRDGLKSALPRDPEAAVLLVKPHPREQLEPFVVRAQLHASLPHWTFNGLDVVEHVDRARIVLKALQAIDHKRPSKPRPWVWAHGTHKRTRPREAGPRKILHRPVVVCSSALEDARQCALVQRRVVGSYFSDCVVLARYYFSATGTSFSLRRYDWQFR